MITTEKIVKVMEETNVDLIILASNKVGSSIRGIGSTARNVIDNVKKPVLIVHE
jgi:nucleotide-binding universal stress UspA family protein